MDKIWDRNKFHGQIMTRIFEPAGRRGQGQGFCSSASLYISQRSLINSSNLLYTYNNLDLSLLLHIMKKRKINSPIDVSASPGSIEIPLRMTHVERLDKWKKVVMHTNNDEHTGAQNMVVKRAIRRLFFDRRITSDEQRTNLLYSAICVLESCGVHVGTTSHPMMSQERFHTYINDMHLAVQGEEQDQLGKRVICSYIHQENDLVFECLDCRLGETCILCKSCYEKGHHEGHKIFFHIAIPGARQSCDCGDEDTYVPACFCPSHGAHNIPSEEKQQSVVSESIKHCTTLLVREIVEYFFQTTGANHQHHNLSLEENHDGRTSAENQQRYLQHYHSLQNHAFERIPMPVPNPIPCSKAAENSSIGSEEVQSTSATADGDGDSTFVPEKHYVRIFHVNNELLTNLADQQLNFNILNHGEGVDVIFTSSEAASALAISLSAERYFFDVLNEDEYRCSFLLKWITKLLESSSEFYPIVFQVLSETSTASPLSYFERLMVRDAYTKATLAQSYRILVERLIVDEQVKEVLSVQYWNQYEICMRHYLDGIGNNDQIIAKFGIQILTKPATVQSMTAHSLDKVVNLFQYITEQFLHHHNHKIAKSDPFLAYIRDFKLLLKHPMMATRFVSNVHGFQRWCASYLSLQGLNAQFPRNNSGYYDSHLWSFAFYLHYHVMEMNAIWPGLNPISFNNNVFVQASQTLLNTFLNFVKNERTFIWTSSSGMATSTTSSSAMSAFFRWNGLDDMMILEHYDVSINAISFHYPLHHLCARYFQHLFSFADLDVECPLSPRFFSEVQDRHQFILGLIEFPIRLCVVNAQNFASLWSRNGIPINGKNENDYYSVLFFLDRDLLLLQVGMANLNANQFLGIYFQRFGLLDWSFRPSIEALDDENMGQKLLTIAEEALQKLIWMVTELPYFPSEESVKSRVRREIIHQLAIEPKCYPELESHTKHILKSQVQKYSVDAVPLALILDEIAIKKETEMEIKYELVEECYFKDYDPCFYHVETFGHDRAQVRLEEIRSRKGHFRVKEEFLPIVGSPPTPHPYFASMRYKMLFDPCIFQLIRKIVYHQHHKIRHHSSHVLLSRVLQLLTLQLHTLSQDSNSDSAQRLYDEVCRYWNDTSHQEATHCVSIVQYLYKLSQSLPKAGHMYSALMWILSEYAAQNKQCQDMWTDLQQNNTSQETERTKLQMGKEKQRKAMELIMKQQRSFSKCLIDDVKQAPYADAPDVDVIRSKFIAPPLICCICHTEKGEEMVYVAFAQKSSIVLDCDALSSKWRSISPSTRGESASLNVHVCGHTLCHDCCTVHQYQDAAFQCPLCKNLSNVLVPHIPYIRKVEMPRSDHMTHIFTTKEQSADALERWVRGPKLERYAADVESFVAQDLEKDQFEAEVSEALFSFSESLVDIGLATGHHHHPKIASDIPDFEKYHVLWSALADTIRNLEHARMSIALLPLHYPEAGQVREPIISDLKYLGLDLGPEIEATLDSVPAKDEINMSLLLKAVSEIDQCYGDKGAHERAILTPLRLMFSAPKEPPSLISNFPPHIHHTWWKEGLARDTPLALCQPLLCTDLLYTLVVTVTTSTNLVEGLLAIRTVCVAHVAQVLLLTATTATTDAILSHAYHEAEKEAEESEDIQHQIEAMLSLRSTLVLAAGVKDIPPPPPAPLLFLRIVQTSLCSFLRQAMLVCRILFRGAGDNASEYANFVSSLRLRSNYREMCDLLGVPTMDDLVTHEGLLVHLRHWARQTGVAAGAVPQDVQDVFQTGVHRSDVLRWTSRPSSSSLSDQGRASFVPHEWIFRQKMRLCRPLPILVILRRTRVEESDAQLCYATTRFHRPTLAHAFVDFYTRLGQQPQSSTCPREKKVLAICLACGTSCCVGSCCTTSTRPHLATFEPCAVHALSCGFGIGVFLILRQIGTFIDRKTLLVHGPKRAVFGSIYIDSLGQADQMDTQGRRGQPLLFLSLRRLTTALTMYVNHEIAGKVHQMQPDNPYV